MKGVCFESIGNVALRELADPVIQDPGDVIVKVRMSGLCGSDLHPFFGREKGLDAGTVMGHELVGDIVETGSGVANFKTGDRVFVPFSTNCGDCYYCRSGLTSRCESGQLFGWVAGGNGLEGCQSSLVRVPLADGSLLKTPDQLSDEAALLLGDNFSTGYYCAEMAGISIDSSRASNVYAVIGCGTVGQLAIKAAQSMGAKNIVAIDPLEDRRRSAESTGVTTVAPEKAGALIGEMTNGRGADAVMELVGLPDAQRLAWEIIRPGGTMSVIGCHCTPGFSFGPADAYDKNLTYKTGRCPARHYMGLLTERAAAGEFDLSNYVTHRFAPDECIKAYDIFSNRRDGCVKAAIVW